MSFPAVTDTSDSKLKLFYSQPNQVVQTKYLISPSASSMRQLHIQDQDIVIYLVGNIDPNWKIVFPIFVVLEYDEEDGSYILSDDKFMIYGTGDTPNEAHRDYVASLIEYYQLLAVHAKDDPATETLFRNLQKYLLHIPG